MTYKNLNRLPKFFLTSVISFAEGASTVASALAKNHSKVLSWLLLTSLLTACGAATPRPAPNPDEQSFLAPVSWLEDLTSKQGWDDEHPRMIVEMTRSGNDHGRDLVGFGNEGMYVATSTGSSFTPPTLVIPDFGYNQGWRVDKHVRLIGDINGDGFYDVVGFGDAGVYRALSNGVGFGPLTFVLAHFGYKQGWKVDKHIRLLADMNGDTKDDIVGFVNNGFWVSLATSDGYFTENFYRASPHFGEDEGWRVDKHIRLVTDVNDDGKNDIVAFGDDGVVISLAISDGKFAEPFLALHAFGYNQGWRVDKHDRILGDMNFDRKPEIVGFNDDGAWISWSTATGWTEPTFVLNGWFRGSEPHMRYVSDFNGDGYQDLLWIATYGLAVALGSPNQQFKTPNRSLRVHAFTFDDPYSREDLTAHYNLVGDVNADDKQDLIIFNHGNIKVALSSDQPPPSEVPTPPSNLHITNKGSDYISIAWTDNSTDEVGFLINWKQDKRAKFASPNQTSFTVAGLDPETDYCFAVYAEGIYGFGAPTPKVCGRTNPRPIPQPTPTPPPPPQQGINRIYVFNCNSEHHPIHIWTLDYTLGLWEERGTLAAQWDDNGSCPGSAAPFVVQLSDEHLFRFVTVDSESCGQNDPRIGSCQKQVRDPLNGDSDGLCLRIADGVNDVVFNCN